ncbi:hypothetical protein [Candidatus Tisiphia endosymbiont of Oplodontha viridula]|uniref:hypothetical protein n=1 Tax=Candidatus Tisiphia endosymbiont of Oplodontha viridula TaxID=3077925 RepID=UPI0035C8FE01
MYIANPINIKPNSHMSLRGDTLVAMKQSRKMVIFGLLRRLTSFRNNVNLLWLKPSQISYNSLLSRM